MANNVPKKNRRVNPPVFISFACRAVKYYGSTGKSDYCTINFFTAVVLLAPTRFTM